jgi:putative nucleotidyltransferase with HDIG domain
MTSRRDIALRVMRGPYALSHPALRRSVRAAFLGVAASIAVLLTLAVGGSSALWLVPVAGAVGAIAGSLGARALRPAGERLFGVATNARLLELANPAHPLLRKLMTVAPGTYTHSVVAANLAEAAAEAIGANPLLARVGAYYHDIGKMARPEFFFENLGGGANPHDGASPGDSTAIIIAHVEDGLELAEAYGLPSEIVQIIGQHHGTSVVTCFYRKAAEVDASVFESAFRYPCDRPHTREAALVMLADGCEAAVRAIGQPSDAQVAATVRKVVGARLADGQLETSPLTTAEVDIVVRTYTRMLVSMYHPRTEYPDAAPRRPHADIHNQPQGA